MAESLEKRSSTTVTLLTPAGRSAIAALSIEGPDAAALVGRHFHCRSCRQVELAELNRIFVGTWRHDQRSEEVVVCRRGVDSFEVNCHGGEAASGSIIRGLVAAGAELLTPVQWLDRHAEDAFQAAAWQALAEARTVRTAAILLDQYRGALTKSVRWLLSEMAAGRMGEHSPLVDEIERLWRWRSLGLHLTDPWKIVLAGPPNVGKSSLVNAIVGYQRSLVYDQPGTTRDVLVAATAIDGWPCELHDTAGLRGAEHELELEGIARAQETIAAADLVVLVADATSPDCFAPVALPAASSILQVVNKIDSPQACREWPADWIGTSAVTGEGLEALLRKIAARLVPQVPAPGEAVPFTIDQFVILSRVREAVKRHDAAAAREASEQLLQSSHHTPCDEHYLVGRQPQ